jgi:hypothetical protein
MCAVHSGRLSRPGQEIGRAASAAAGHTLVGAGRRRRRNGRALHASRIVHADVLLGCDLLVAAGSETLARLRAGHTRAVINTADTITGDIVRHPELGFPHEAALGAWLPAMLVGAIAPLGFPVAAAALVLQAWRVARWRGWRLLMRGPSLRVAREDRGRPGTAPSRAPRDSLVLAMHLGFLWLLVALALRAASAVGAALPASLWVLLSRSARSAR